MFISQRMETDYIINIDAAENYVRYLANATESDVTLKVYNISTDTLYTSISLGK